MPTRCRRCRARVAYDAVRFVWRHVGRTTTYRGRRYPAGEPHSHRAEGVDA